MAAVLGHVREDRDAGDGKQLGGRRGEGTAPVLGDKAEDATGDLEGAALRLEEEVAQLGIGELVQAEVPDRPRGHVRVDEVLYWHGLENDKVRCALRVVPPRTHLVGSHHGDGHLPTGQALLRWIGRVGRTLIVVLAREGFTEDQADGVDGVHGRHIEVLGRADQITELLALAVTDVDEPTFEPRLRRLAWTSMPKHSPVALSIHER